MASTAVGEEYKKFLSGFYDPTPPNLSTSTRELLENYSGIPGDQVISHCTDIRDRAFRVFPYPCVGQWRFLDLSVGSTAEYPEVLRRIREGELYLDIGCCFAQDIRKLAADGVPQENLYGTDLRQEFFDLGYELFRDRDTLKATFIATDFFDPRGAFDKLHEKVSIIYASSFLHLFSYETQKRAAVQMVGFLRRQPGSIIFGRQTAQRPAGTSERTVENKSVYRHDELSFAKFWNEVGDETGLKFRTDVQIYELGHDTADSTLKRANRPPGQRLFMKFSVVVQ